MSVVHKKNEQPKVALRYVNKKNTLCLTQNVFSGVGSEIRTHGLQCHKLTRQASYAIPTIHIRRKYSQQIFIWNELNGTPYWIRTSDLPLRRRLLYPTELMTHTVLIDTSNSDKSLRYTGAGDGNRTHMTSLEGWSSTTELHPHTA